MTHKKLHNEVYGTSQCAIDLATILRDNNNSKHIRKVGRTLAYFNAGMIELSKTNKMTENFYKVYLKYTNEKVEGLELPSNIKTRVLNLIKSEYRKHLNQLESE
jgi:uncharacterized protein YfcZ (UPF0381/DUF406 family)